jgi:hypothetical protein
MTFKLAWDTRSRYRSLGAECQSTSQQIGLLIGDDLPDALDGFGA